MSFVNPIGLKLPSVGRHVVVEPLISSIQQEVFGVRVLWFIDASDALGITYNETELKSLPDRINKHTLDGRDSWSRYNTRMLIR